jgi:hypothetical protein
MLWYRERYVKNWPTLLDKLCTYLQVFIINIEINTQTIIRKPSIYKNEETWTSKIMELKNEYWYCNTEWNSLKNSANLHFQLGFSVESLLLRSQGFCQCYDCWSCDNGSLESESFIDPLMQYNSGWTILYHISTEYDRCEIEIFRKSIRFSNKNNDIVYNFTTNAAVLIKIV